MKLTKPQARLVAQTRELLQKNKLSLDEKEFVLENYVPANMVPLAQFFTPYNLASQVCMYTPDDDTAIVDFCAGIGGLAYHVAREWRPSPVRLICIEKDVELIEIGKKIVPEAEWLCGDIFDKALLDEIIPKKAFAVLNPPYGKSKKLIETDYSWIGYQGDLALMALEVAFRYCKNGVAILRQDHCPYKYSGQSYFKNEPGAEFLKFEKHNIRCKMIPSSIDTTCCDSFKFTNIITELVPFGLSHLDYDDLERIEQLEKIARPAAKPTHRESQLGLF